LTLRPLLEEGMARGDIKKTDPELLSQAVVGLNQHIASYWLEHQEVYTREQIKIFLFHLFG
jgi:hypothetical protein